ncbi:nuclear export mediator factor NEMF-like [Haliotis rubra]|uniref:nuclear export mediator factor NEMF-like n=1 Tax=Haliotis rubra TaxID=36100 RepID=UPI001EE4F52D|nr:nuclear export mediator factor NEMF-like [Haliotis rubra]
MKSRFSTVDISAVVKELQRFLGMRVVNIYDIDNKTYLIRLAKPDQKVVILLESGIRLHSTEFDWPKNPAPSGFSMKMRKHLKGRRLECIQQLGVDRIVDFQFGSSEAAYHVILELYDRGNIVLTDYEYTILNILRPRTDNSQDVRFAVRETYPVDVAKQHELPTVERLTEIMSKGKDGDPLKKLLVPNLDYGPAVLDHCLLGAGFTENCRIGKGFDISKDMPKLLSAIEEAEEMLQNFQQEQCKGYITQRIDKKPNPKDGENAELLTYEAFHPFHLRQDEKKPFLEFASFDRAADQFFSQLESQRLDMMTLQQEKTALKKLDNVKKDHDKRLNVLQKEQEVDILKGQLIEMNLQLVDQAILIVRSALANQIDWTEIWNLVKEAQLTGDPVAGAIKSLKLDTNHVTLLLKDPYVGDIEDEEEEEYEPVKPMRIDIDLSLSAYANSRKFFDKKRQAAKKEQKTMDASKKAFKSAEKKTKQTLKEVATIASINKTRKTYWFEKFLWFISSENYLVIGGRDQQQNELIVKRYLRPGDLYVHADLHGASSCIIKNPTGIPVPPKTLNEAGTMAICNSAAWDAKVVTSAWYVHHDQVSKTAPSGEYLTTGSFMIRGRKNYLPPSYLIYGFGFLFKLEEDSVDRHLGERKVRTLEEDEMSVTDSVATDVTADESIISDDDSDSDDETEKTGVEVTTVDSNEEGQENEEQGEDDKEDDMLKVEVKIEEKIEEDTEEKSGSAFPDTSINLLHVKGDKYELQRGLSTSSTASGVSESDSHVVYLGDSQPVVRGEKTVQTGAKFSAKQRREQRKARKGKMPQQTQKDDDEEEEGVSWMKSEEDHSESQQSSQNSVSNNTQETSSQSSNPQTQHKRGQKGKQRKMKEKYKDQDDEERSLRMEILASAGSQKEDKKKKGKKGKDVQQLKGGKPSGSRPQSGKGQPTDIHKVTLQTGELSMEDKTTAQKTPTSRPVDDDDVDEEKEAAQQAEDIKILNSLTGCPVTEDELLYAIPVCAPYNTLTNYKYKVKLLPGNTKRGKAVKAALNVFLHDKSATSREKDLLRILKDDQSRNMPGKVKVAAPQLHRKK